MMPQSHHIIHFKKAILRDIVYDHFSKEWLKVDHGRQSKHFFPYINKARSYNIIKLPKKIYSRVVQFCTGHCWLKGHCKVVAGPSDPTKYYGPALDDSCRFCEMPFPETPAHILGECLYTLKLRQDIFNSHILDPPFTCSISKLVKFLHLSEIEDLQWHADVSEDEETIE